MRDLVIILIVALLSTGLALWVLRRQPARDASQPGAHGAPHGEPDSLPRDYPAGDAASHSDAFAEPGEADDREQPALLAVLEFDVAPWNVAMTQPEVIIGRHSQDDIRIPDVRVSRHHARMVAKRGGIFEIHNLTAVRSEPNPMLINGQSRERANIGDGDVVTLGGVSFTLRHAA